MKFDDVIIINKVLELYTKFERDVMAQWSFHDTCLIYSTLGKDSYQIQIQIELKDDNTFEMKIDSSINLKIKNGELYGANGLDNTNFEGIKKLEEILIEIADKELEILYQ